MVIVWLNRGFESVDARRRFLECREGTTHRGFDIVHEIARRAPHRGRSQGRYAFRSGRLRRRRQRQEVAGELPRSEPHREFVDPVPRCGR